MTAEPVDVAHPVTRCVRAVTAQLDAVAGTDPGYLDPAAMREALVGLTRAANQLAGLRMAVMATAGQVAAADGARSVAAWLAPRTGGWRATEARAERLGQSLADRWRRVAAGVATGAVSIAQAEVITDVLETVNAAGPDQGGDPDGARLDPELLARAEAHLVELAAEFGPRELRRLGEAIWERLDPDRFADHERAQLAAAERRAAAQTRLTMRRRGDGCTDLSARIPDAAAARLRSYLAAWTSPRHDTSAGSPNIDPATGQRLRYDRVQGHAFCALLEAIDPTAMPVKAGAATTVVVTIDLDALLTAHGIAQLADGTPITAAQARRLACNAGLLPAVLGGDSEILDLGRSQRLFTGKQKLALALRHPTCRAEGCTIPATWCEAHHHTPWSTGGNTDLANGTLLCPWHHHRTHDPTYTTTHLPNGDIRYHRRT